MAVVRQVVVSTSGEPPFAPVVQQQQRRIRNPSQNGTRHRRRWIGAGLERIDRENAVGLHGETATGGPRPLVGSLRQGFGRCARHRRQHGSWGRGGAGGVEESRCDAPALPTRRSRRRPGTSAGVSRHAWRPAQSPAPIARRRRRSSRCPIVRRDPRQTPLAARLARPADHGRGRRRRSDGVATLRRARLRRCPRVGDRRLRQRHPLATRRRVRRQPEAGTGRDRSRRADDGGCRRFERQQADVAFCRGVGIHHHARRPTPRIGDKCRREGHCLGRRSRASRPRIDRHAPQPAGAIAVAREIQGAAVRCPRGVPVVRSFGCYARNRTPGSGRW